MSSINGTTGSINFLSEADKAKVRHAIETGLKINQDIAELRIGLKATVNAVAEELGIKPALINRAIRVATKSSIDAERSSVEDLESLLHAAGRA